MSKARKPAKATRKIAPRKRKPARRTFTGKSAIHGIGIFAATPFARGDAITRPVGRFRGFNHANRPNVRSKVDRTGRVLSIVATRKIKPGEELTLNYEAERRRRKW